MAANCAKRPPADWVLTLGWELIQFIDFEYIFTPDLSRWGRL
jgi:hypothetical protein